MATRSALRISSADSCSPRPTRWCGSPPPTTPRPGETGEEFFDRIEAEDPEWGLKTSREIRFSAAATMALDKTVEEADALGHKFIRPEHLLLGFLRDEGTEAWRTLHAAGVSLREVRRILGDEGDTGEPPSDWGSGQGEGTK
jgi:hypothetical protein